MKLGAPASGSDFFGRNQVVADLWRYLESEHIRFSRRASSGQDFDPDTVA